MLGIDKDTRSEKRFIEPGKQQVKLVAVRAEPTSPQDQTPALCFDFAVSSMGDVIYTRRFYDRTSLAKATDMAAKYPRKIKDPKHPRNGQNMTAEEYLQDAISTMQSQIKHIMTKFMPEEETFFRASDWRDFCEKVIAIMNSKQAPASGIELDTVFLYNKKGFMEMREYIPFLAPKGTPDSQLLNTLSPNEVKRLVKPEISAEQAPAASPDPDSLYSDPSFVPPGIEEGF